MSYNFSSSPYAAPRKPPKWPWAFATVLVLTITAATVILLQNGLPVDDGPKENGDLALVTPTPEENIAPTVTPIPTPTPATLEYPAELTEEWITLWMAKDYAGMYSLTTAATQENMTESAFIEKYDGVARVAGITNISVQQEGDVTQDGTVKLKVTYESGLVGEIQQDLEMGLRQESQGWRVAWSPSLIFTELGSNGCVAWTGDSFTRGKILDSQGRVLAEDKPVTRVSVIPANVTDPATIYPELARVLDMPQSEIESRVNAAPNASWEVALKDMPASEEINLLNALNGMDGVRVRAATQRYYPYANTTVHLVGYVTLATQEDLEKDENVVEGELVGRSGIEFGANEVLSGTPGGTLSAVECTTRAVRAEIAISEGQPPADVTLTVDAEFQKYVDEALTNGEREIDGPNGEKIKVGERAAVVVMDPETGAILAMVSHPTFDPNGYVTQNFSEEDQASLNDPVMLSWLNRAVSQPLPTGSIFKVITTAGAMDTLGYTDQTLVECPATFTLGDESWDDWVVENGVTAQGTLTLHQALVNSCNTVFYGIGADMDQVDPNALPDMSKAFGLGQPVNMEYFPSSAAGVIPDPAWKAEELGDGWATGDNIQLSIGQGFMLATPLQMAVAYSAIANGGDVLVPYVVASTQVPGEESVQIGEREVRNELPLNDQQIEWIQTALRSQTSDPYGFGSTKVFGDFAWTISGKTGTAQNDRANEDGRPHSWFAAYAPVPFDGAEVDIASIVMVENAGEGVTYAAPITKDIYQYWLDTHQSGTIPVDIRRFG